MKKTLIAGAASVALAAMPVLGVFAASGDGTNYTDHLSVTITNACTFARGTDESVTTDANHVAGDGGVGTWGSETLTANTLSGELAAGTLDSNFGASNFVVVCNNEAGWKVTAAAGALNGLTTTTENIPLGNPAADTAAWNYTSSSSDTNITGTGTFSAASQIVAQSAKTTDVKGRTFKVQYAVSVDHELSAQTYEGDITYTFAQL